MSTCGKFEVCCTTSDAVVHEKWIQCIQLTVGVADTTILLNNH